MSAKKVRKDLHEAIFAEPNNTMSFATIPFQGVTVQRGRTLDGLGIYLKKEIEESLEPPVNVAQILRQTETDIVVSYLPVGSEQATQWYAEETLKAGCAFINCVPVFIASQLPWQKRFYEKKFRY